MSKLTKLFCAAVLAANAVAASADGKNNIACNVTIDYSLNNVLSQSYNRDFLVAIGSAFSEDLSTPTRQRDFSATLTPEGGNLVVTIAYFSDVGTFDATSFSTQLKLSGGKNFESAAGNMTHFHTQGSTARHSTDYTLTCRRQ